MSKKFRLFTQCRKNNLMEKAKLIGFAAWIVMQCRRYSMLRLVDFRVWVIPAIDHKQIGPGKPGPMTQKLRDCFEARIPRLVKPI